MKFIWAYDPFQENKELTLTAKKIINSLFLKNKSSVTVLYVASRLESELTNAFDIPEKKRFSSYPKELIAKQLKTLNLSKLKIEVLSKMTVSLSSIIEEIIDYTLIKKTNLVLVPSNNKTLLPRLVFGSFSETFVHRSVCDLLIYHQKTKFTPSPLHILYAHDFSTKGEEGLKKVIEYAKEWNAKITILHVPVFANDLELEKFQALTKIHIEKTMNLLVKNKISHEIIVSKEIKLISKIILSTAKRTQASLIALSAQTSNLNALLGGSVTRQVLRETKIPALVLKV